MLLCLLLLAKPSTVAAGKALEGVVNLNTAPPEILALLPGIGPAKATAILVYRKRRPFRTVDELVRIKGVGRKMVRRLRLHLAVAGPTTAAATTAKSIASPVPEPPKTGASKPAAAAAHGPRTPTYPAAPAVARSAHPSGAPAHLRARGGERSQAAPRPWRAACLGAP